MFVLREGFAADSVPVKSGKMLIYIELGRENVKLE